MKYVLYLRGETSHAISYILPGATSRHRARGPSGVELFFPVPRRAAMLAALSAEVAAWARRHVGADDVPVLDRPRPDDDGPAVLAWLFAIRPVAATREGPEVRHGATCRFLVSALGPEAPAVHALVDGLLAAAVGHDAYEVEREEPDASLWRAVDLAPRPAFVLRAEAVAAVERPRVPPVLEPLVIRHRELTTLAGRVVGPGGRAVAGAEVTLDATGARSRTGSDGGFTLPSVLAGTGHQLTVRAGRARMRLRVDADDVNEPLLVHLPEKEA